MVKIKHICGSIGIFGLLLFLCAVAINTQSDFKNPTIPCVSQSTSLKAVSPITLSKNSDIDKYSDVITGGTGSVEDPFIFENLLIENLTISPKDIPFDDERVKVQAYGIYITGEFSYSVIIRNCVFRGLTYGIFLENQKQHQIVNNSISDTFNTGIYLYSSSNCLINNNSITRIQGCCILLLMNCMNNQIEGNMLSNSSNGLDWQSDDFYASWAPHGVYLWDSCDNNSIRGNELIGIDVRIGGIMSYNNTITKNHFHNVSEPFRIGRVDASNMAFVSDGNRFFDNTMDSPFSISSMFPILVLFVGITSFLLFWLIRVNYRQKIQAQDLHFLIWVFILLLIMAICYLITDLFSYLNWGILYLTENILMAFISLLIFLFANTITNDTVNPKKISLIVSIIAVYLFGLFQYNFGLISPKLSTFRWITSDVLVVLPGLFCLNPFIQIIKKIYRKLKFETFLLTIASFVFGIFLPLELILELIGGSIYLTYIQAVGMGFIGFISTGVAIIFTLIAFARHPEFSYIIQSDINQIIILDTQSGVSIYSHVWEKNKGVDDTLFSGMLQGISLFVQETLKVGMIQEIKLQKGILLLQYKHKYPIACILFAERSTFLLRQLFLQFTEKFIEKFSDKFGNMGDVSKFEDTKNIISEVFPFR